MARSRINVSAILENLLFVWFGFSAILLVGIEIASIPPFLQVLGRAHPLLLHFPIVLVMGGLLFWILPRSYKSEAYAQIAPFLLLLGANFSGLTVIAGLILSSEGYEGEALFWHQWAGMITFWGGSFFYFFQKRKQKALQIPSILLMLCIVLTGHWGAAITHGEDFLLAPLKTAEPEVTLAEAEVFEHLVRPILKSKCESCHQDGKVKGELRMDIVEGLQKGGKSGPFVLAGDLDNSLLIQRINLPLEEEEHMPPKNKTQLTEEEMNILTAWVNSGASFDQKVADLPEEHELFQFASNTFANKPEYDFDAVSDEKLEELNTFFRKVNPIYPESPALELSYFGIAAFDPNSLSDLREISTQLISLNLDKMPLGNASLDFLNEFPNLEKLSLNFAELSQDQLERFPNIESLKELSLSGIQLSQAALERISGMKNLEKLFLWQTGLSAEQKAKLKAQLPKTEIDFGFDGSDVILPLNSPRIRQERILFTENLEIEISHPIPSVEIRYSIDGTEPDSLSSPVYESPISVTSSGKIRAKAFAKGWIGSQEVSSVFMKSGIKPTEYRLLTQPNPRYQGDLEETLFDQIKGENNHTSGEWLGYSEDPFVAELMLKESQSISELAISLLYNESAYIFPPTQVEIIGWKNGKSTIIHSEKPEQSEKIGEIRSELLSYSLKDSDFEKIQVKLYPIQSLPPWHPGAGAKGWVFVDEILLN
ncbi:c-type cytochrome domain-containing protein [Algoriphagus formosus]|uniref:c-type cytochrome domain-containing protein n=1 Tax=Algoriphagus formosus TaxID=2007308 RepID=UPI003F6FF0A3